ncbi:hypothetical protein [Salinarimonas chemoclinalis]|uniref:hypothetical protein n=1 Tax=Salinarimonas chemoclinalis TaxID=3241599 RepID=UPI0035591729
MTFGSTALVMPIRPHVRRLAPFAAAGLLAATLGACSPYGRDATGAVVGGAAAAGVAPAPRGEVVCEFDPLYGRDVCYR